MVLFLLALLFVLFYFLKGGGGGSDKIVFDGIVVAFIDFLFL